MIGPLLKLAAATAAARTLRIAAADVGLRLALALAAMMAGAVGLGCFTYASVTLLERQLDPAAAWSLVGLAYAVGGLILYFAATRRRTGR